MDEIPAEIPDPGPAPATVAVRGLTPALAPPDSPDPPALDEPLTPEARALPSISGTPAVLGGGETWLLAEGSTARDLGEWRDKMFDQSVMSGKVLLEDVRSVAWALLRRNYRLTGLEAARLVVDAPAEGLADSVFLSLFGGDLKSRHVSYTDWSRSALAANGLSPDAIPPDLLSLVLHHLVETRRAVPHDQMVSSTLYAVERKAWNEVARRRPS